MTKKLKQIAIYGKGGIGKSTTTSNISAALSEAGYRVMQFGCDPKADSTTTLRGGEYIPSVLDLLAEKRRVDAWEAVFEGWNGIYCVEAGGPAPGVGCAGRGIITAVELLKQQNVFEELDLDFVIYDVLGDVVCGGFAVPVREGIAEHVFTVSSADFMAIYAANNLFRGIEKFSSAGGALLGGIIANSINTDFQREIIDDFAAKTGTPIIQYVPRSLTVTQAELSGRTTIEAVPESAQAEVYRQLARSIAAHEVSRVPTPLGPAELRQWSAGWADQLVAMERAAAGGEGAITVPVRGNGAAHAAAIRAPDGRVARVGAAE
ncbi:nitrogenase iron protein [Siculibacillus lacustris]|uniref:Nitrogenase iron protein n=1 Tax=Siculibacillus lacustris TaxID=1549641 RepID=A0A4V2KU05_9HYPH|nr:nitrogenase iron protein [Siculibacillus lacustris]